MHGGSLLRVLLLVGRLGLGAVFVYAAYTKLRPPWEIFAMSMNSYQLLPEWAVIVVARTLPWLELFVGALLLVGYQLRYVAAVATALLLCFFVVMLRSYFRGLGIDCGCFGVGEALSPRTLARDGVLLCGSLALTVGAFFARRSRPRAAAGQASPSGTE